MKKKLFSTLALISLAMAQEKADFIDDLEYGKRLYADPRGISCQKCHGSKGEGGVIATYRSKGNLKELIAPSINNLTLEEFAKNINKSKGVMPKYYLTEKEINAIYKYLNSNKQKTLKTP